ncbi:unnamed protein product [Paramecium sonneborni]|uniref:Transmembrane protein n=1 Tax=Paramecium sonneborni TaxID=65129 RepID=A0A8S1LN57_9CILI|nr:unnamed protein product [Paramecium sonneborni]
MIKIINILSILNLIFEVKAQLMDPLYQVNQNKIFLIDGQFTYENGFNYGLWSKYNPFSLISQVGPVGLFESNCFQLQNAVSLETQSLNLIYFDCLDYQSSLITKSIYFVNNNNEQHKIQIKIDNFEYEDVWYFCGMYGIPNLNELEIIVLSVTKVIFHHEILKMSYPFYDLELQFTFGNSLIVHDSKISSILPGTKFSYFPGPIILKRFTKFNFPSDENLQLQAFRILERHAICDCIKNQNNKIADTELNQLDYSTYLSEKLNCDYFLLSGWIRIKEIVNSDDEFIYQFIRLAYNFENSKFSNKNLHPFSLSYLISPLQNKIIVSTYSYTFPIVTLDFLDNPFLKQKEFNIINDITLWHYLYVNLNENSIDIQIKFLELYNVYEFRETVDVIQFKQNQLKLFYGNIDQIENNYLNIKLSNVVFYNCYEEYLQQSCHISCQECDGPTNQDCLSCSIESRRTYIIEKKTCICPYNTIDVGICHSYQDSGLILIEEERKNNQCNYGYFEYLQQCILCPSIITEYVVTCLECLQNPQKWSENPNCKTDIFLNSNGSIEQTFLTSTYDNFIFDSIDVQLCFSCDETNFYNQEILVKELQQRNEEFKNYCTNKSPNCYKCGLFDCLECYVTIQGLRCSKCNHLNLINGFCNTDSLQIIINPCVSPYYITSNQECKLCTIQNCKQCFEYQKLEQELKCTLYRNFDNFYTEDIHIIKIGCALCDDNYIFDFDLGICMNQQSQIEYCLRSYINLQGQEICTLSSIQDFSIASEIINCQKYVSNCIQCILNPDQKIQCIICKTGYSNQIQTGSCFENSIENAIIVMEGDFYNRDASLWLIQSFMMSFLPNNYYYPPGSLNNYILFFMPIQCTQGYQLTIYQDCVKYCSEDCLQCQRSQEQFICQQCPLNYFYQPIRIQENGQCIQCPQLCDVCRNRQDIDIYNLQPKFKLTQNNKIYTKICVKQINNINVVIDPYYQIAKYCYTQDCWTHFLYQFISEIIFVSCINSEGGDKFSDLEKSINTDYLNQVGVDQIIIDYTFYNEYTEEICYIQCPILYDTYLKTQIFSLRKTILKINFKSSCIIFLSSSTIFQNFDQVEIYNISFIDAKSFLISNDKNIIDLKLSNILLKESKYDNITIIQTDYFGNIEFFKITLMNLNFYNSSFLNLASSLFKGYLQIDTLLIENCFIFNSDLLILSKNNFTISIKKITINSCNFVNSSIFRSFTDKSISQNSINFEDIIITNSNFANSYFINSENNCNLNLNSFQFKNNFLKMSIIISFDNSLELSNVQTIQNTFIQSQFIATNNIQSKDLIICNVQNYSAIENQLEDSNLFFIFSSLTVNRIIISITDIQIVDINQVQQTNTYIQLFKIHGQSFQFKNAIIQNIKNCILFYIVENQIVIMENVIFQTTQALQKVPLNLKCIDELILNDSYFLHLNGFQNLKLTNIQIINQQSTFQSQIQVEFSRQFYDYSFGEIELKNVLFEGNILLQRENADLFSLIVIYSQDKLKIVIDDMTFTKNFLHQYIDNPLETSAGLIYLQSQLSNVEITNLFCQFNSLTNSSNSFIVLNAYSIKISNFQVMNHNILPYELLQSYFQIQLNSELNQDEINLVMQQSLKILNKGGAGQIIASSFTCQNCQFRNILAYQSAIFDIKTQQQGEIELNNISAKYIETNLQQISGSGCISIYSQNSILNLKIVNAQFTNILTRMSSTILTIQPSTQGNKIILKNIEITNCISLLNQFFSISFQSLNLELDSVHIQNITAIQAEDYLIKYFSKIGIISQSEIQSIISDNNAVIKINQGNIKLINIFFEGIFLSPIFKLNNLVKLKIENCWLLQIQTLYPFNLISISSTEDILSTIYLDTLHITKSSAYLINSSYFYLLNNVDSILVECIQYNNLTYGDNQLYLIDTIKKFTELASNSSSLIYISINSIQHTLHVQNLNIQKNNCTYCYNGIINLSITNFKQLKIQQLYCGFNIIKGFGCLSIVVNTQKYPTIKIYNSNFINNQGNQGTAIMAQNIYLNIDNCRIVGNQATLSGGGIHLFANKNALLIKKSIILYNQANQGGGIYLVGNNQLNQLNFISSLLLFNKAILQGNNLVETPSHLALSINGKEMNSQEYIINNTQTNLLNLKPYKTIQQGIKIISNILILPSNQQILNYLLYHPKSQRYLQYLSNFSLLFKNSRNEQIKNLIDSNCIVSQLAVLQDQFVDHDNFEQKVKIQFDNENNNFNLGLLSLTLNPYQISETNYLIKFRCQTTDSQKNMDYIIKTKSFSCQLGEFYVDNGCQICQSNQGFYSVTYNATKCSVFDKSKYQSITSNKVELLKGYWRPNIYSDSTDYCFKNPKFCEGGWNVGNELCSTGHIGGLCEECDYQNIRGNGKYIKTQQDQLCLSCYGDQDSILPFILTSIWALLSIILSLKSINQSNQLFTSLKLQQKFFSIIFKLSQDHESIFLKMLLNYLWIYSVIYTFNITFSFSFIFVDQVSNTSAFMANNLDCYLSEIEEIQLIYSRIITMLILMIFQLLLILILSYIYFKINRQDIKQQYQFDTISNTLIYLYISNFGGLIKMFSSVLSKREISGLDYIQGDVSLEYWSSTHFKWTVSFIIPGLVIFCILIPFFLLAIMYKLKDQFDSIKKRRHISYLFNEYNNGNYYWELIKLTKKTIIILILTYFETQILLKASLLGLCLLFYQLLAVQQKPYIISNLNHLDLLTGQICSITIFLAASKYVSEQQNNQMLSILLQIIIIILCILLCFPFFQGIFSIYYKKYYILILNSTLKLFEKIKKDSKFTEKIKQVLKQQKNKEKRVKYNYIKLKDYLKSSIKIKKQMLYNLQTTIDSDQNTNQKFQSMVFLIKPKI